MHIVLITILNHEYTCRRQTSVTDPPGCRSAFSILQLLCCEVRGFPAEEEEEEEEEEERCLTMCGAGSAGLVSRTWRLSSPPPPPPPPPHLARDYTGGALTSLDPHLHTHDNKRKMKYSWRGALGSYTEQSHTYGIRLYAYVMYVCTHTRFLYPHHTTLHTFIHAPAPAPPWGGSLPGPGPLPRADTRVVEAPGQLSVFGFNPGVREQGAASPGLWPSAQRGPRQPPLPQCIISKWTDLYIKVQTTSYSGQAPVKASAPRWIKSIDRMMDNPRIRAGPGKEKLYFRGGGGGEQRGETPDVITLITVEAENGGYKCGAQNRRLWVYRRFTGPGRAPGLLQQPPDETL